ncbi:DUF1902 domain-containing protein [Diaphorobacter sp. LR2014-1]|uniref:DUF1902 domain-containing protein n=1 Tax=Diaphorobacter sp. LR2014-1 TaxID=1933219 RepID=UPI000CDB6E46|nr:DUF1902 domain-containing protein [Diaphorobacter sp. LR2014-1]POR11396.1 hypothetical protein BV908_06325 [Diaphorobacter sp. LR2014-1]
MYRVGNPFWRFLARLGIPLVVRVDVVFDSEADVYVATSPDLRGLVAEAKTKDELISSVYDCVDLLLEDQVHQPLKHKPLAAWDGELRCA